MITARRNYGTLRAGRSYECLGRGRFYGLRVCVVAVGSRKMVVPRRVFERAQLRIRLEV